MAGITFSIRNIIQGIRSPKNKYLVAKISFSAFAIQVVIFVFDKYLRDYSDAASLLLSDLGTIAFFGLLGLAGLIVVIRQELPQVVTIRGKWAVINGVLWLVVAWTLMIIYIYFLLVDIMKLTSLGVEL